MKVNRTRIHNRIGRNVESGMSREQAELEAQQWARRQRIRERMKENPADEKEEPEVEQGAGAKETVARTTAKRAND